MHTVCVLSPKVINLDNNIVSSTSNLRNHKKTGHGCEENDKIKYGKKSNELEIEVRKAEAAKARYWASIALKVNLKAGGTNHVLHDSASRPERDEITMFIGIHIHTPELDKTQTRGPSIAGVVANIDQQFAH